MTEKNQIKTVAGALRSGAVTGAFVDDDDKADRFIAALTRIHPTLEVAYRGRFFKDPERKTIFLKLKLPAASPNKN